LTGVRVGIIFQSISCTVTGLIIGFFASWKLTLVVLCFSPIMLLASKIRSPKVVQAEQSKDRDLYLQQGGQVLNKRNRFVYL
jgi:ABC-type bacteriocin/lantibiotic exporter with double-glycine peptidase domain